MNAGLWRRITGAGVHRGLGIAALAASALVTGCDLSSVSYPNNPSRELITRMTDDPASFKGQAVTIKNLTLNSLGHHPDQQPVTLHEYLAQDRPVPLYAFGTGNARLDLKVIVPKDLQVPNAKYLDTLEVTFQSTQGSLTEGNIARSIKRWGG